ncbi:MAG: peptide deformylase [Rhodospirillales bacterium]|nr:peptide deformylase [Rhodospirillales bacterium]
MALLPIIVAPDPRLKIKAEAVDQVDDELRAFMHDMLETMYAAPGIGLAGPQVGLGKRVIVVDVRENAEDDGAPNPYCMVNPQIIEVSREDRIHDEGCLSLPDQYAEVERPDSIRVRYTDENNTVQELDADGLLATCIQHEIDHLDGILFVDHITALKRKMILRKLTKIKKLAERESA